MRFGARIVTKNGRDAHRELNGFFFPVDNTITLYEFHQFGTRFVYNNGRHFIMHLLLLLTQIAFCTGANWKLLALLFNHYQIPPVNHLLTLLLNPTFSTRRSQALPFIQRGCYNHVQGRRKGQPYTLMDIFVVSIQSCTCHTCM